MRDDYVDDCARCGSRSGNTTPTSWSCPSAEAGASITHRAEPKPRVTRQTPSSEEISAAETSGPDSLHSDKSYLDGLGREFRQASPWWIAPEYAWVVPRPRRDLTTSEKRHLHSLEGRMTRLEAELQATRREWAELVEEAGQAAAARELGVSRQAVADRLRRIRANHEGRSGRR
jgi:hypothetical protein